MTILLLSVLHLRHRVTWEGTFLEAQSLNPWVRDASADGCGIADPSGERAVLGSWHGFGVLRGLVHSFPLTPSGPGSAGRGEDKSLEQAGGWDAAPLAAADCASGSHLETRLLIWGPTGQEALEGAAHGTWLILSPRLSGRCGELEGHLSSFSRRDRWE